MVLPRPTAMRGFAPARLLRSSARSANRVVARRGYASGHGHSAPSSDLPWILGSAGFTIPAAWYLWPDSSHGDAHGAHAAHAKQVEEHPHIEESKEEEQPQEESKEEEQPKEEPKEESKDESKAESTQDQPQSGKTPAEGESKSKRTTDGANQPENKGDVEGVKFKGPTSEGDEQNRMPDERKREPDSKGAFKKRIDSGYGKNLGEGPERRDDGSESAATAKSTSQDQGDISKKQQGLSTTPTRHSTDITQDPNMSKKGEGAPDTAKSQGTISVNRPQPELKKGESSENAPKSDSKDE